MAERLTIVETETAVLVVWAEDPEDWVARFAKRPGFPARAWAERMVGLYARRAADGRRRTPDGRTV
jgi:hypothetical protein